VKTEEMNSKQGRQCTYNVILRRIRETLLPWKSNKYYTFVCMCARARVHACVVPGSASVCMRVCACRLYYPACKAYAPCCDVTCGLWFHHIFRHYLINGTIFGKKLLGIKCVFWFSL
jgi:hypothetical protein